MEQIYTQSHEEFEVFTTVMSPQVCRRRMILKHQGEMVVVAAGYSAECDDEVCVCPGEVVLLLYQENPDWCYVRLQNGKEGYLPTACFTQESLKPIETHLQQSSMQKSSDDRSGCARGHSLKLPRRASLAGVPGSPRLLKRLLSRPRRRSDGQAVRLIGSINPAYHPD
ncbi:uncharacterized protein si:dkey-97a13.12 [Xyrauchen texanus]|uniref:uncharacterized protein si:dkey-97a13.12 n=1 Tax=Xyrauchen texanus TaxID=154827 RepID=UPI002242BF71|nr:uncharacterized protein si:dkey-97a13.12 [Xyrauchen texanus]